MLELTIEDPAEAFEDLRDKNDLKMLLAHSAFTSEGTGTGGGLGPPANKAWVERWRITLKIAKVRPFPCCGALLAPALKRYLRSGNSSGSSRC